jgi:2-hydroxychromene-2-carboxylate isomerase
VAGAAETAAAAAAAAAATSAAGQAAAQPEVEYWFSTLSTYTYLSTMRIEQQAQARGVNVVWKPFNVR